jgi:hypothetical protein
MLKNTTIKYFPISMYVQKAILFFQKFPPLKLGRTFLAAVWCTSDMQICKNSISRIFYEISLPHFSLDYYVNFYAQL